MKKVPCSHRQLIYFVYSKCRELLSFVSAVREECCMRLLVVEDHPELGPDLKKGLEHCHYAVDLVTNGEDALALGETIPYDLIILDILLPGPSGLEVCRQLREQRHAIGHQIHCVVAVLK